MGAKRVSVGSGDSQTGFSCWVQIRVAITGDAVTIKVYLDALVNLLDYTHSLLEVEHLILLANLALSCRVTIETSLGTILLD